MFALQISTIESQRQAIFSQIEELNRKEQELVEESRRFQQMEEEGDG
ncbi:MAG: hypothetical protein KME30_32540 [Iphinoe sp. HA4291-MV1]|jgi:hypothetical protein|nr:hypothetical protein [Iphinoe sp. HA4291-MV1]